MSTPEEIQAHAARAKAAWGEFRGDLDHNFRCLAVERPGREPRRDPCDVPHDDPLCDCGVRALVAALEAL